MRGLSSVGRALPWHGRGQGFNSPRLHEEPPGPRLGVLCFFSQCLQGFRVPASLVGEHFSGQGLLVFGLPNWMSELRAELRIVATTSPKILPVGFNPTVEVPGQGTFAPARAALGPLDASRGRAGLRLPVMGFEQQGRRSTMPPELTDRDRLVRRLDEGLTVREIANETGTDPRRVNRALRSHGLRWVPCPRQQLDVEWLTEQHATRTGNDIAEGLGVTRVTVYKYLRRAGL
jgi:DNA-binding CsgD family transcriptional regulator